MSGVFIIEREGARRIYHGRWMGEQSTAVFVRGPGYARDIVSDLDRLDAVVDAASGFLLDFDAKRALLFDTAIVWPGDEAEEPRIAGVALRVDALRQLDLYPEEAVLIEVLRAGTSEAAFFEALRAVDLKDSYRDWSLGWVRNAQSIREGLTAR